MVSLFGGGSGLNLGSAYASIRIDLDDLQNDMRSAQNIFSRGLSNIGPSIQSFGQSISQLGQGLTVLTAPITAFGATGLRTAADFEVLTRQISVFGGVTGEELEKVRQHALAMGAATMFSASDAAAALLDMLKSGQSVDEAMASLGATLNLAAAGEVSLAQASGIVTSAMAQFGLVATDAGRIADALARGANASRADVAGLGDALANVGPIADQFGLSLEDTIAVLAVFSQNGIEGSDAGTKLRAVLNSLFSDAGPTKEALAELGVTLYDNTGATRNFNDILRDLNSALADKSDEERNRILLMLTDTFGLAGLNALLAADGIGAMQAAMAGSADAAEVAEGFMGSFKGTVEELKGSLETLQINVITPMIENTLTPFVAKIVELVNRVNDWALANPELAQTIARVAGVVAMLGPALVGIGKAISFVGFLLTGGGAIAGGLVAGLALLYGAFQTNFLGIRDLLGPIVENITEGIGAIVEAIGYFISDVENFGIEEAILGIFGRGTLAETMESSLEGILVSFGMTRDAAVAFVDDLYDTFMRIGNFIQNQVLPPLQAFANWFLNDALPAVVSFVTGTVAPAVSNFFNFLGSVWELVWPNLSRLFNWLVLDILPILVSFVQDTVIPVVGRFIGILEGIWRTVSPWLGNLVNWFLNDESALPGVITFLETDFKEAFDATVQVIKDIWDKTSPKLEELKNWIVNTAGPEIQKFIEGKFVPAIQSVAASFRAWYLDVKPDLDKFNAFVTGVLNAMLWWGVEPLKKALVALPEETRKAIADALNAVLGFIEELQEIMQTGSLGEVIIRSILRGYVTEESEGESRDFGGPGLAGSLYMLTTPATPEAYFVPPADGQFIPNFDQVLAGLLGGAAGAGEQVVFESVVVNANSAREGREAADAFVDRIHQRYRERT